MEKESFEQIMAWHAGPFLAGFKPASLVSFQKSMFHDIDEVLAEYEPCFNCKGISTYKLSQGHRAVMMLFYRRNQLQEDLRQPEARALLQQLGYPDTEVVEELLVLRFMKRT